MADALWTPRARVMGRPHPHTPASSESMVRLGGA